MEQVQASLSEQVVDVRPLSDAGASGNRVELVTLRDGRELVRKRVSPAWDWLSRATGDHGRALTMWRGGTFDRIPTLIDHATVAVEPDGDGWTVFMRDVSSHLLADGRRLRRNEVARVLAATAELHGAFLGDEIPDLCPLVDRYLLLSPRTARRERDHPVGDTIARCWEVFVDLAPADVADPILQLAEDPEPLARQLARCTQTLVHGDVRLSNLGLSPDQVVVVDWGERTGMAPAPVELASFLAFDAKHLDVSREDVIADYRALAGDAVDDAAVDLALIGGLVQLACHHVLGVVLDGGERARAAALEELSWWSAAVVRAFDRTWSPV